MKSHLSHPSLLLDANGSFLTQVIFSPHICSVDNIKYREQKGDAMYGTSVVPYVLYCTYSLRYVYMYSTCYSIKECKYRSG